MSDLVKRLRACSERGLQGSVGSLLHEAADELDRLSTTVAVPVETLERWKKDLGSYWFSDSEGESYNNDEILAIDREIEALLFPQPRTAHSMSEYRRVTAQGGEVQKPKAAPKDSSGN